ncbi:hypothetical protein BRD17_01770 [Halobacteriales archaeon SW_7_68_16]|nr:MAG: hypothetical protein BRD17_01770 [Halobacteriales archaeon SW_7_68_16]
MSGPLGDEPGSRAAFLREIGMALRPLGEAAVAAGTGDMEPLTDIVTGMGLSKAELGESWDAITAETRRLGDAWTTIDEIVVTPVENDEVPDLTRIDELIDALGTYIDVVRSMDDVSVPRPDVENLGERFLDYLLITYLANHHPVIYAGFALIGVIDPEGRGAVGDLELSELGDALQNPNAAIQDGFEWGSQSFEPYLVLFYLRGIVAGSGLRAAFEPVTREIKTDVQGLGPNESWPGIEDDDTGTDTAGGDGSGPVIDPRGAPEDLADDRLVIDVLSIGASGAAGSTGLDVTVSIIPVPGAGGSLPGFAVMPAGMGTGDVSEELDGGWSFNAAFSAEADWALRVRPTGDGGVTVDTVPDRGVDEGIEGEAALTYDPAGDEVGLSILDDGEGSGVVIEYAQALATVDYDGDDAVFDVRIPVKGRVESEPSGGFLSTVLPDRAGSEFETTLGWSTAEGLYLDRGGTLDVSIPVSERIGPAAIESVFGEIATVDGTGIGGDGSGGGETGRLAITAALTGTVELGPVTARFKRMGVTASRIEDGDAGGADVAVDFKAPEGVGIAIDAGTVGGGGYLGYDPDEERYSGIVQLNLGKVTINAVGLLTTELPDGSDGFSLLVMLTGEFPPIQLGAGFALTGLGGLVGVNRSVKAKRLGTAVRSGDRTTLLFPENPVANADRIVSDLRTFFPPRRDRHVVGPIAQLTWGGILTGDLGVVLELPTGKVVLMGVISAVLPDERTALLDLNMILSGYIDPPNRRVAIDASLFDSRVATFPIAGDMAMRMNYGDDPRFLLSVGGWNPRYSPPKGFPELDRVRAVLGNKGGNPRIELNGYFAITSNTVQVGADVHAVAEAGPARAEGHLSFDAFFQFGPFKFAIDFAASLSVTVHGKGLTVSIDGTLMGPGPFRLKGTLHIELMFIDISVTADVTIGPSTGREKLPTAMVLPEVRSAFGRPGNWSAQLPAGRTEWATFRDIETDDDRVLAHPLGTLGVRQTVVPLDFTLETFRNARPADYTRFEIGDATVGGSAAVDFEGTVEEEFAPAQYLTMTDDEKLSSPAFESHPAGKRMRHAGIYCGTDRARNGRTTRFGYESTVIDRTKGNWGTPISAFDIGVVTPLSRLSETQAISLTAVGAVANARGRRREAGRFSLDEEAEAGRDALAGGVAVPIPASDPGTGGAGEEAASDGGRPTVVRGGETPDEGGLAGTVSMADAGSEYAVVERETLRRVPLPGTEADDHLSKAQASRALERLRDRDPDLAARLQIVEAHRAEPPREVAGDGGGERT